ncbi:asparaginyl-tRNA synthetase [Coniophora puteana RWD-64-598 SS2]|uniref:Asparagine--tRNA ligase, mitochondrial n=1 Tax=Coniophora puteana (strain RWD-64-598) TaxID=741705 RepID=A0A5M3MZN4_CONPW|nr:asparaginyl-tRNA synthetase [Coniophora puteana RWD-64-598 SS2]EIW84091.1 asparaginyl-tRNA synthetase [Coniophora puteana RWD-64-598 SS2]
MLFRRFASTSRVLPPTIRQLLSPSQVSSKDALVEVNGWVKSVRRQKNVVFAVVSDGTCASGMQAVLKTDLAPKSLTNGASVRLCGRLVESRGRGQARELQVEEVNVTGDSDPDAYPIQKQSLSTEYLRDHVHLRSRTDTNAAMLRVRNSLLHSIHNFFEGEDFCYVHTPILTSSDCEGAGETFRVQPTASIPANGPDIFAPVSNITTPAPSSSTENPENKEFFGKPTYLTVSSQLYLEAIASSLSRVYTLSPAFRAERSQTSRHLAEFWMLEAEWAFIHSVDDLCSLVENSVKATLRSFLEQEDDISALWGNNDAAEKDRRLSVLRQARDASSWPRMTYTKAIEILQKQHEASPFEFEPIWGNGLQSEHEQWLAASLGGPVFVTDYPKAIKPFYMRLNSDKIPVGEEGHSRETVACFDLLIPEVGELVGGSVREERLDFLLEALCAHGLASRGPNGIDVKDEYKWYVDLRRYGSAPHGGFGLGFERLVSWVTGIENVRECIAMPRWAGRMVV